MYLKDNTTLVIEKKDLKSILSSHIHYYYKGGGVSVPVIKYILERTNELENAKTAKKIILPEIITEIDDHTFEGFNLEEIIIPDYVVIGEGCFENCKKLKRIIYPKTDTKVDDRGLKDYNISEVELSSWDEGSFNNGRKTQKIISPVHQNRIVRLCFRNCGLEEISIPESVIIIQEAAFCNCEKLKKIILPKELKEIHQYAFYNSGLEELNITDNVTYIGENAFGNSVKLRVVNLPEGLKTIAKEAFRKTNIEEISIPKSVTLIGDNAFGDNENLRKVNIYSHQLQYISSFYRKPGLIPPFEERSPLCVINTQYTSYDDLYDNIRILLNQEEDKTYKKYIKYEINKIVINFIGPELNESAKRTVEKLFKRSIYKNVFIINFNEEVKEEEIKKENKKTYDDDEEINEIVTELYKICNNITNTSKKEIIKEEIKNILKEYKKGLDILRPKLQLSESKIDLTIYTTVDGLKRDTLMKLYTIKTNLYNEKKYINELSEIEDLHKLLSLQTKAIEEGKNELSIKIIEISQDLDFIGEKEQIRYIDQIKNKLIETHKRIKEKLNKQKENNSISLTLDNTDDFEEIKKYISNIHEEIKNKSEKLKDFKLLYNCLCDTKKVREIPNYDTLEGLINGTRYIIDKLDKNERTKEIENKFKIIVEKYKNRINQILNTIEPKKNFKEIENELRKELQELLKEISNITYLDIYEKNSKNNINILNQLEKGKDIIKENNIVDEGKYDLQVIDDYIVDIRNKVIENRECIDKETENEINIKLLKIINDYISLLSEKRINNSEEYYKMQNQILSNLADINIKIDNYIYQIKEYNEGLKNK